MSPFCLQVGQTVFSHDQKFHVSAIRQFKPQNMFSESQTLLDTTTHSKSSLNNLKVGLALLSALENGDGTVRVPFFPVAVFSKHCVCAQLVKEELSRSAVLAATFELGMPKQLPIYWPIFHKDSTLHLCSGLLGCCLSISGPDSKHWLVWRSLCWFVSQPSEELPPHRPKPICSRQKLPSACQWQQLRTQNSDQGDFNSTNYLLNQMDLVWKYPKHLHFQGFPIGARWASCKNTPKQIHPESQGFNLRPQQLFFPFHFHKYWSLLIKTLSAVPMYSW